MKKIPFVFALIAFLITSISAQSCAKTMRNKAQNSVAIVTPPVDKMSKIEDKKSVEITAEKPTEKMVETTVITVVDKPIIAQIDTQKMAKKPEIIAETISAKSVIVDTLVKNSKTTQVIENKPVIIEKIVEKPV